MILAWFFGCGAYPFENDPPAILSFNGVPIPVDEFQIFGLEAEPGQTAELHFEVKDPERDAVLLWFPYAPEGWSFDPRGTEGTWTVPENIDQIYTIPVIAIDDDKADPRSTEYSLVVNDSYYYGYYE